MINFDNVMTVYSSRRGCACDCRGSYKVASKFLAEANEGLARFLPYDKEDVSDRSVRTIVNKVLALGIESSPDMPGIFWADSPTRSYTIYMAV